VVRVRRRDELALVPCADTVLRQQLALPNLVAVAFNGGTAAKIGMQALAESRVSLDLIKLPSSSPAYAAVPYAQKLRAWEALRKWLV